VNPKRLLSRRAVGGCGSGRWLRSRGGLRASVDADNGLRAVFT